MQSFRSLKVCEKSHALTLETYHITRSFPREELYGLTSQMRRAASSIGMNIAENCCRKTGTDLGRFLQIASGSAGELEYQMVLALDLNHVSGSQHRALELKVVAVKRMLSSRTQRVVDSVTCAKIESGSLRADGRRAGNLFCAPSPIRASFNSNTIKLRNHCLKV
jgi:four helix bundle protein